jgi:CubicO group peptidase (beta-lactamase class C family)
MNSRLCFLAASFLGIAILCQSQEIGDWTDSYVKALAPTKHFSGTIWAERDGKLVLEKNYGYAVEEWRLSNSANTKFEIASLTKQFTAAAILQLQDAGKLNVLDPVGKYYPDAPTAWKGITLQHLLTHTSGLPENDWKDYFKGACTSYTTTDLVKTFRDRSLTFQPGTRWQYRNTDYYLLAYIVEKVSGQTYGDYLSQHIFEPLHMIHSGFVPAHTIVPQMAEGYSRDSGTLHQRQYYDRSMETGAGGIYTTGEDMLLWNKALDSPGLLSTISLQLMFTPHPPGNYSYGWFVESSPRRRIFHEGGDPGFAAFEVRYPDEHLVIVVLANEDDSPVREIGDAIAHRMLGD